MSHSDHRSDNPAAWAAALSRRKFLRWTALAAVASMVGWRFLTPAAGDDPGPLSHLSSNQAKVLAAAYQTITGETKPESVREALRFMDGYLGRMDGRTRLEFSALLALVEHSPLVFHGYLGRFSSLPAQARAHCLTGWRRGATWRRPVYCALKDLSYLYYYTRPANWAGLGYAGPLVSADAVNPAFERRYQGLEAKS
ncbi:MAG: hypothetical protein HY074_12535 [Deltaproteobacteria bacterium]|nr:hypothetical protein [Deltaproteobacteria bacterium]